MTIVVAGATGLAGSAIVRAYEKAGKEVIGINRSICDLLDRDATIDFIKKLSTEIQNGLIKFVFNVIVDKECGELDSRIDDQMCAFLYLLYDTLKTKTRGLSSLSKLEYFDEFKKYTKSKAMKEMVSKFKKTHFVPQYVTMLHYLQEDVKTDWVIELVFKSSDKTVVSSRKELRDFFADNSKNLFKVNDVGFVDS